MYLIFLILCCFGTLLADTVILNSGVEVEGDIIGKSDVIIKIHSTEFNRVIVLEKAQISIIEVDGKQSTFEDFLLTPLVHNPTYKLSPKRKIKQRLRKKTKLFRTDVFEDARRENIDSSFAEKKAMNLFYNSPARWGSLGFGYFYTYNLASGNPKKFREFGFSYDGKAQNFRLVNAQIRRNLRTGVGTVIIDFGYGKKTLLLNSRGEQLETAILRFAALKYSWCPNRWLFSPGIQGGLMFVRAGVIRYGDGGNELNTNLSIYDHGVLPIIGVDLNFYDLIDANISWDFYEFSRFYLNLVFLMPFLQ